MGATLDAIHSPAVGPFVQKVDALLTEFSEKLGQKYTDMSLLWDCLHTHICHNFPIPPQITQDMFKQVSDLTLFETQFGQDYNNSRVARYGMGPLVAEMQGNMDAIINGTAKPTKFWLYSGHDTGPIMPLLSAFHIHYDHWCPYASMIVVEMYT